MRALTAKNIFDKKTKTFPFDGDYLKVMGNPEVSGAWIVYAPDKNGKTWFSVKLADYMSKLCKVLYISAEEGVGADFKATCHRAKIDTDNKNLKFLERIELDDLSKRLKRQRSPKVIFIDNMTVYRQSLKGNNLQKLLADHPNKLFVFIAHQKNNEPFTAAAQLCKILAKIIVRIEGLACFVSGRCPGGTLMIDEEKALLYHSTQILDQ